ncbi:MAG: hypothetical protein ACSLFQ_17870 [Thermoanaerobaculia bacterium]
MKHGKKASKGHAKGSKEALSSKAGAKGSEKVAAQSGKKADKPPKAVQGKAGSRPKSEAKVVAKAAPKAEGKAAKAGAPAVARPGAKTAPPPAGGKTDSRGKAAPDSGGLRPDIAAAFQRVLKKFPDALRRLAD